MIKKLPKKTKRQDRILKALEMNPAIRVNELAAMLNVSLETIRRDLKELDANGSIKRTYGGAVRTETFEPHLTERLKLHVTSRQKIADHAVGLLGDADSLFIGGGATTLHFARALKMTKRQLTVLTASFSIATELSSNPLMDIIFLPGKVEAREGQVYGPETLDYISRYRTPITIVGASAVNETGVSEALLSAAQIYEAMIKSADRTIVLADSSKMGGRSLRTILGWGPNTQLVTEKQPDQQIATALETAGATLMVPL